MAENDLKVIGKAKDLAVHSFRLTSNCNRYPKKYRHSLVDKIQIKSLEIYEKLYEAGADRYLLRHETYNEEHYQKLLKESHKRLSNFSYQEQLIVASNGNNEIVSLLKKYNSSHRLDFVIDVDSILHNYELENIADDNNNKIEEKITEVADVVEEVSINEKQETKEEIKLFCRKCGTELLLDSDFCHRCGEKVEIK